MVSNDTAKTILLDEDEGMGVAKLMGIYEIIPL